MTQHTLGPWVPRKDGTVQPYPGTGSIAACSLRGNHEEMAANARLIAAAPAMLEALREAVHVCRNDGADGLAEDIAAILARIDGEQTS